MKQKNPLLGTLAQVHVTSPSADIAEAAEAAVFAEVERLEAIFTVFDDASALHELRRTGSTEVPELREHGVVLIESLWMAHGNLQ